MYATTGKRLLRFARYDVKAYRASIAHGFKAMPKWRRRLVAVKRSKRKVTLPTIKI